MTTLADMTPAERAQCRGLWCDTPKGLFILLAPMFPDREAFGWQLLAPSEAMKIDYPPEKITPRDDLPRAWQADGTPPAGEWQTAKAKVILNVNAKYDPEQNVINGDGVADPDHEPRSSHDIRRWIGDWETIEEGEEA